MLQDVYTCLSLTHGFLWLQTSSRLFMFPFQSSGKSKSIAVRAEDVSRLDEGEFLNDTLIEFGLKYDTIPKCVLLLRRFKGDTCFAQDVHSPYFFLLSCRYIHSNLEKDDEDLNGKVHIFNTFFYQRLLAKPSYVLFELSSDAWDEQRRNIDNVIFSYSFFPGSQQRSTDIL